MDEIPDRFLAGLNGGVVVSRETRAESEDLPDIFLLGEYVVDDPGLGRLIIVYWGSFREVFPDASLQDIEDEVRETLLHEARHHLESLAGVDELEREDLVRLREFLAWTGQG